MSHLDVPSPKSYEILHDRLSRKEKRKLLKILEDERDSFVDAFKRPYPIQVDFRPSSIDFGYTFCGGIEEYDLLIKLLTLMLKDYEEKDDEEDQQFYDKARQQIEDKKEKGLTTNFWKFWRTKK